MSACSGEYTSRLIEGEGKVSYDGLYGLAHPSSRSDGYLCGTLRPQPPFGGLAAAQHQRIADLQVINASTCRNPQYYSLLATRTAGNMDGLIIARSEETSRRCSGRDELVIAARNMCRHTEPPCLIPRTSTERRTDMVHL